MNCGRVDLRLDRLAFPTSGHISYSTCVRDKWEAAYSFTPAPTVIKLRITLHFMRLRIILAAGFCAMAWGQAPGPMRPPAVPLVAHDPYFSMWSMADRLNADGVKHWTGKPNSLTALVRIDGKILPLMGCT